MDAHVKADVIQILGGMDKNEKFNSMHFFTGEQTFHRYYLCLLISTPAADTGIDQEQTQHVSCQGFPRNPIFFSFQGCSRNARQPGMTGEYCIFTDWLLFVKLLLSILLPLNTPTNDPPEYEGVNIIIKSKSHPTPRLKRKTHNLCFRRLQPKKRKHRNRLQQID